MTNSKVVVFGSLHYDIMIKSHRSPMKGETLQGDAWQPKCGGKGGNQAVASAKSGVETHMVAAVANDTFGLALVGNLLAKNVNCDYVRKEADKSTGMSVAMLDAEGDYSAIIVSGSNLTLNDNDIINAQDVLQQADILLLQSEVPEKANIKAAQIAKQGKARILLNAAPARDVSPQLQDLVDIVIVNEVEAEMLNNCKMLANLEGAMVAAKQLLLNYRAAIVTIGASGVVYANRQNVEISLPAEKVKLQSTHGAGDEFIGVLAGELAKGKTIDKALYAANHAAAVLVSTPEALR